MRLAETRDGASFYTLFGPAIQLGVISRRKAYSDTIQYEKDRNAGFLSPFGYSTPTVKAAVDAICSMEVFLFYIFPSLFSSVGLNRQGNQTSHSFSLTIYLFTWQWYWLLASKSQVSVEGNCPIRIWRWKGYLVQVFLLCCAYAFQFVYARNFIYVGQRKFLISTIIYTFTVYFSVLVG